MNSDKFDRVVLDLLYGELDELTSAAAKRHMEQSARAREIYAHFKATRQLSVLPTHAPPADFELTLLERERSALAELPFHHRIGRIVSMLAGYAMRPQLIMGALLLLMIGSSLMFLRARPGQHSAVQVTERGAPEADVDLVLPLAAPPSSEPRAQAHGVFQAAVGPLTGSPSSSKPQEAVSKLTPAPQPGAVGAASNADAGAGLDPFDQAVAVYRAGKYGEAQRLFERISRTGGQRAPEAALYSAQAIRNASGCALAVSRFDRVRLRFPGSGSAYEAAWRAAKCLHQLGDVESARQNYESLLQVASHAEQARHALQALGGTSIAVGGNDSTDQAEITAGVAADSLAPHPPSPTAPGDEVGDEREGDDVTAARAAPQAPEPGALSVDASVPPPPATE
jgi:TolA-binding protein